MLCLLHTQNFEDGYFLVKMYREDLSSWRRKWLLHTVWICELYQLLIWHLAPGLLCRNGEEVAGGHAGDRPAAALRARPPAALCEHVPHAGPSPQSSSVCWLYSSSSCSKSSLADGRSVAKPGSPSCFSIRSPCTTVVFITLLTLRLSTCSD